MYLLDNSNVQNTSKGISNSIKQIFNQIFLIKLVLELLLQETYKNNIALNQLFNNYLALNRFNY